ncbi:unnamed protein product, partial [marine sediment metagenome]
LVTYSYHISSFFVLSEVQGAGKKSYNLQYKNRKDGE